MKDTEYYAKYARKKGFHKVYPDEQYIEILKATGIVFEDRGKIVLDVGCGTGAFSFFISSYGFNVKGMDISADLINLACVESREREKERVEFFVGDVLNMPVPANSIDIIFCGAMLHHLPKHLRNIAVEFYRVLKDGGKVYFFEPYSLCLNSFIYYNLISYRRTDGERALNPEILKNYFLEAGFENYKWQKLVGIKHLPAKSDGCIEKVVDIVRALLSKYIMPNVFFAGSCSKRGSQ